MQVLEHQQHRAGLGQLGEHAEDGAEQLLLRQAGQVRADRPGRAGIRKEAGQHRPRRQRVEHRPGRGRIAGGVPQGVGERQVGNGVGQLGAAPDQHGEPALTRSGRQLSHQPRLADPGIAAHQRHDGLAGGGRGEQALQLA